MAAVLDILQMEKKGNLPSALSIHVHDQFFFLPFDVGVVELFIIEKNATKQCDFLYVLLSPAVFIFLTRISN